MAGLKGELREELATDLESILAESPGWTKWQLLNALEAKGWSHLSGTDVNSVLYEVSRDFVHDESTPPRWWLSSGENSPAIDIEALSERIQELLAGMQAASETEGVSIEGIYDGPSPRPWQEEALAAWRAADRCGVVEAVTGTGKTLVGVLAAAEMLAEGGKVAVVVPGRDLLDQWYEKLLEVLPDTVIGRMGDGFSDSLTEHDVLVATVQSACKHYLLEEPTSGLLIADEVHHYGAERYAQALEPEFEARLGLTATYERSDHGIDRYLSPYFDGSGTSRSEVVMRCDYERGLADEILARFRVALVGVEFTDAEREAYEDLDGRARSARGKLINSHGCPQEPFGEFMKSVTVLSEGDNGNPIGTGLARSYLNAFSKRRALLADSERKLKALDKLAPVLLRADRGLVFSETKASAEAAALRLLDHDIEAEGYTSDLCRDDRKAILAEFRSGELQVLCAPRVLDEGVDVPEADVGVIMAASHSRRQMIQRMGRIIRPKEDDRCAAFFILYVRGSAEDPEQGAHGAFLEEMTEVAEEVTTFSPNAPASKLLAWYEKGRLC